MDRAELEAYVRDHFTPARQHAELTDAHTTTFIAIDTRLVGYAQITVGKLPDCPLDARNPAELKRIYVDRAWHGQGVAQKLVALVNAEAYVRGCDTIWLAVWEINDRAIAFYGKSGFRQVGRQGFPIGNEIQSDYVMAKPLADELH